MALELANAKTRVLVIYTGGTIGMVPSDPSNRLSPLTPATKENLLQVMPGLGEDEGIYWDVEGLYDDSGTPVEPLDSSNVSSQHWRFMAAAIENKYHKYDG